METSYYEDAMIEATHELKLMLAWWLQQQETEELVIPYHELEFVDCQQVERIDDDEAQTVTFRLTSSGPTLTLVED